MGTINIQVVARIATNLTPAEVIVCNNSGYTLAFTFDEEWAAVPDRVARFVYKKGCQTLYQEQPFEGNTVAVPELRDVDLVHVGVYAGDIQTTTPATIMCRRSILGGDPIEELPAPVRASLQRQIGDLDDLNTEEKASLVAAVNEVLAKAGGEISDEQVAQAVSAYLAEHPVQAGATAEQAAQIQANKEASEQLQQTGGSGTPDSPAVTDEQVAKALADYLAEHPIPVGSSATIGTVNLPAANWTGGENLYSQVVSIEGVTENSQVDLTPSVEQLVVFYEKDLTLVAENEGGTVTVYAIGQKPEHDYTIQVTITEVQV